VTDLPTADSLARDALQAVREALNIPHGATTGDEATRAGILENRVRHTLVMLETVLDSPRPDIEWSVAYLRDRLAEHPATGYQTWAERWAGLDATA
jgi:hypothetical protein